MLEMLKLALNGFGVLLGICMMLLGVLLIRLNFKK